MANYQIQSNIPAPPLTQRNGPTRKYPFKDMQVGDSFFVPLSAERWTRERTRVEVAAVKYANKNPGVRFTCASSRYDGGLRCWRIA